MCVWCVYVGCVCGVSVCICGCAVVCLVCSVCGCVSYVRQDGVHVCGMYVHMHVGRF